MHRRDRCNANRVFLSAMAIEIVSIIIALIVGITAVALIF